MKVEVTVDTSRLDRKLADLPACLARAQKRALQAIGEAVATRAKMAFRTTGLRPSPWAPRRPSKADDGHPLLIRGGVLIHSIGWRLDGNDAVTIGSSHAYSLYHQFGTRKMPARPFFPIDKNGELLPAMRRKIVGKVKKALREELEKL